MTIGIIIACICLAGAAILDAIRDTSEFHPERLPKWWRHDWTRKYIDGDPAKGRKKLWRTRINYPVQLLDGFHFSKMACVILLVTGMLSLIWSPWWIWLVGYAAGYILWNVPFNLFYNRILPVFWTLFVFTFSVQSQTGYNAYALDRLTDAQIVDLSRQLESGMDLRFGGNEYVTSDIPFEKALRLSDLTGGGKISVSTVRTNVYTDADRILGEKFGHVTYGNEPWLKLNPWSDILSWIFNKRGFYTNAARQYMKDAEAFANATGSDPVVNVPLPQNPFLQAWLDEVSRWNPKVVSIHVYGKPWEVGYYKKLEGWLKEITDRFDKVIVGEFNGIALHVKPEYKDTEQQALSEARILGLFEKYGIEEVYFFTLVATSDMMKWRNAPVYPKFVIE